MMKFIKKHPILSIAGALAAAWAVGWIKVTNTSAAPQPGPQPQPGPTPPPQPGTLTSANNPVPLGAGSASLNLPAGQGFSLQLLPGATWASTNPVTQTPQSVVGGTVNPLVPTGTEAQNWDNVTGNGTIVANWLDASGAAQTTTIAVATTSTTHVLGA